MTVKFVSESNKEHTLIARDEVQAAAFKNAGLVPAPKENKDKLKK